MAQAKSGQDWIAVMLAAGAAVFVAASDSFTGANPEEPDELKWVWLALSGAMVLLLLFGLVRLNHLVAGRPERKTMTLVVIVIGLVAAGYSVLLDIGNL